jgi:hypothetical protein
VTPAQASGAAAASSRPSIAVDQRRPHARLRAAARDQADVAALDHQFRLVAAADQPDQVARRRVRRDVVVLRQQVQARLPDVAELHPPAADRPRASHQPVAAQELVDHLAEDAARERDVVALPLAHAQVADHHVVAVDLIEQVGRAGEFAERPQRAQRVLHPVGRHVAELLDQPFDVEALAHPGLEQDQTVAVDRCGHANQVLQRRLRMQGGIQHREQSADAVADDRQFSLPAVAQDRVDAFGQQAQHMVFERQVLVLAARAAPLDQVDVEALAQQVLDHALPGHQVEDVGLVDERGDDQHRHAADRVGQRLVMVQLERAAGMDGFLRRHAQRTGQVGEIRRLDPHPCQRTLHRVGQRSPVCPSSDEYVGRSPKGIAGRLGSGPALGPHHDDLLFFGALRVRGGRSIFAAPCATSACRNATTLALNCARPSSSRPMRSSSASMSPRDGR